MPRKIIVLLLSVSLLQGCVTATTAAVGITAGTGLYVYQDRREPAKIVQDNTIEAKALYLILADKNIRKYSRLNVNSYNGNVLVTGQTLNDELLDDIQEIVSNIRHVKKVYNEVTVDDLLTLKQAANDTYITSAIKGKLLAKNGVNPLKIKVVTENSTVYLMGIVTNEESRIASKIAKSMKEVKSVVKLFEPYYPQ